MAVTNLAATLSNGQVFIEWDQTANASDHLVYRHTVEITDANVGAATLVATVPGNSARNLRRTADEEGTIFYTTPNGARANGKGLAVITAEASGDYFYGVIVSGDSFSSGNNATTVGLTNSSGTAVPILQGTATMDDGRTARIYCYWSAGNASYAKGLIGFTFAYLRSAGFVSGTSATTVQTSVGLMVRGHGGTASYFDGQIEMPQDLPADVGFMNIDDVWLEPTYGNDTTYGLGAGENHPTAAQDGETVNLFIRTAYKAMIDWVIANEEDAMIDANKVWIMGQSAGGAVALRLAHHMRTTFAAALAMQPPWDMSLSGMSSRDSIDDTWGTLAHNNLADDAGTTPIYNLGKVSWEVANADDDYPPITVHNGTGDAVTQFAESTADIATVQSNGHQITASWDANGHGSLGIFATRDTYDAAIREIMEHRLNKPFLALRNCSLDDDIDNDATGYVNGTLRQYPLEATVSSTRCSVPLSLRHDGLPYDAQSHVATVDIRPRRLTSNSLTWAENDYVLFTSHGNDGVVEQRLLVADANGEVEATGVEVTREKRDMVFEDWTLPVAANVAYLWASEATARGGSLYCAVFGPANQPYDIVGVLPYGIQSRTLASGTIGASGYSLVTLARTAFGPSSLDFAEGNWRLDLRFAPKFQNVTALARLR